MLNGLLINGYNKECIDLFQGMDILDHIKPNIVSFVHGLTACINCTLLAMEFGEYFYNKLNEQTNKWMLADVSIQISLLNMYSSCGKLDICKQMFSEIKIKEDELQNIAVWNTMIKIYGDNGELKEADLLYNY